MVRTLLGTAIGLVAANFLYQAFGGQNYATALDRSFFQLMALASVYLFERIRWI